MVLPDASSAVQRTGVLPIWKVEPLGGTHATVGMPQLSVATGAVHVMVASHTPASVLWMMSAGHIRYGFSLSSTRTVNEALSVFADASVAMQFTVVAPTPKTLPDGGIHVTLGFGSQLSVTGRENVTTALQRFGSVFA